ncbi:phosphatidylserine decarboxylase [Kingella negevensis]|uniref:phosphatidylserine decarboxylase n=1 Tax=Kingella negevensis TaxID=1522312 RepID=UPI00254BBEBE|nr:phosphatidylserine decarboxylase [Kingella negevensis]MDK4679524.1 phosphatidylserine decarboxylase [Kingella negevensis]MDK4682758.1 phosphatidylserine decarboxylase [Kingella negevensis]MDK4690955.1 phosphatidylserine decarboxylase [Kingella negevensis]MDK4693898.1 phosphatidylserine decarboxylase [Kingella negevensis]MDK4700197.1 phosphatidylserine decarboxylase [Kingella negevensis]
MNRFYPYPLIAREGWCAIGVLVALSACSAYAGRRWTWWLLGATALAAYLFRDSVRNIPMEDDVVLCPSDGRVVLVEKATDPVQNVDALKISIYTGFFRGYAVRSPARGRWVQADLVGGKHCWAWRDKAGLLNRRYVLQLQTDAGVRLTMVQSCGKLARDVQNIAVANETVVRGERLGFTTLGGRVDVYLPIDVVPNVAIGDRVKASSTVLARLAQENAA